MLRAITCRFFRYVTSSRHFSRVSYLVSELNLQTVLVILKGFYIPDIDHFQIGSKMMVKCYVRYEVRGIVL